MVPYDRLLVPTDGSTGMAAVLAAAGGLATTHGASVHLLYVVDTAMTAGLPLEPVAVNVTEALSQESEQALASARRHLPDDVPVETATREGRPAAEIVAHAGATDCDLVVMGTHGRTGIGHAVLGSVAERVVRSAPMPVLTVPVADA